MFFNLNIPAKSFVVNNFCILWPTLVNKRGHASEFATANTPGVTEALEQFIVLEFAEAIHSSFDVSLDNIQSNPQDPPDCFATIDGRCVHIELVEFVDGDALAIAKKTGRNSHNDANQFNKTQWCSGRFLRDLNTLIDKKEKRYQASGKAFDCLLIYSAEPWLLPNEVAVWLRETNIAKRKCFRSAYFLMTYDPLYSREHYPVFRLFGDLG